MQNLEDLSIYIHYPFCISKCPYCDFNSYCNIKIGEDLLLKAYLKEIGFYANISRDKIIDTIFFGGGTPSLMSTNFLSKIINEIYSKFNVSKNCEISLEANPNSINFEKITDFKAMGINRLSIGVQSLRDIDLKIMGRIHNRGDILNSIKIAENIFHDNYSIDMIHSRPKQSLSDWEIELKEAVKLSPYHMSVYQLIVEKSTPFHKNKVVVPGDDLGLDFLNLTRDILEENGLKFYEISNYAAEKHICKHNMKYWENGEWLGIGAGAHGRINTNSINSGYRLRYATKNIKTPNLWLENVLEKGRGYKNKKYLSKNDFIEEFILMGLRVVDGIKLDKLQKNLIGCEKLANVLNMKNVEFLNEANFLEYTDRELKLTKNGFIMLNSIIEKIIN